MYRTHTCGELRLADVGKEVILSGWVQHIRELGAVTFITLRDRFGLTQLFFSMETNPQLCEKARDLGREFVIQVKGKVAERSSKNELMPTGAIELLVDELSILNTSKIPPFTIEDDTDGSEELRMRYRYLDLRRKPLQNNLMLRHRLLQDIRQYLSSYGFMEIETPFLIKSTPEGARDFVVPSRVHRGEFYALPQSPQTFKQLLMISGYDRYFQIVKCFRDEDLRADRQPEFTQIDCELSFVNQEDVIEIFTSLAKYLFKQVLGKDLGEVQRLSYRDAMQLYGSDKPDIRFDMQIKYISDIAANSEFAVFNESLAAGGVIAGINAKGCANYSRKQLDAFTEFVKEPQRGMKGLIWVKWNEDGGIKSSVDKFFNEDILKSWLQKMNAEPNDLLLIVAGAENKVQKSLGDLRLHVADQLGLRDKKQFAALWVVDFPMFEWNEEGSFWSYMHHPFTSPKEEDMNKLFSEPGSVNANAYDFVINGNEIGGGSIRIHDRFIQNEVFKALGLSEEEIQDKFGFLLNALEYGAPPHGGIAFGFDRLCAIMSESASIREVMAFPKNNAGRDLMLDAPDRISEEQLRELHLQITPSNKEKE